MRGLYDERGAPGDHGLYYGPVLGVEQNPTMCPMTMMTTMMCSYYYYYYSS